MTGATPYRANVNVPIKYICKKISDMYVCVCRLVMCELMGTILFLNTLPDKLAVCKRSELRCYILQPNSALSILKKLTNCIS